MKQFVFNCRDTTELLQSLIENKIELTLQNNHLCQIFVTNNNQKYLIEMQELICAFLPNSLIVACSGAFTIETNNIITDEQFIVSILSFQTTKVVPFSAQAISVVALNQKMLFFVKAKNLMSVKAIQIFSTLYSFDMQPLLSFLKDEYPEVPIFGAGSTGVLLCERQIIENGIVVLFICGDDIQINTNVISGWTPIGESMTITEVKDRSILTIDDEPAVDVYQNYLGTFDSKSYREMLSFPFFIEKENRSLIRAPILINRNDGIELLTAVDKHSKIKFSYGDISEVQCEVKQQCADIKHFEPEVIFIFSCQCRYAFFQNDVLYELNKINSIVPSVGIFSFGEICDGLILNASSVVVSVKENIGNSSSKINAHHIIDDVHDNIFHQNQQVRLFRLISKITNELKCSNKTLKYLSQRDPLTNLLNKREFIKKAKIIYQQSVLNNNEFSIIMIDVDNFKYINDKWGHQTGDNTLIKIAKSITKSIRCTDILARYGGEEFILMLPDTNILNAKAMAERIRVNILTDTASDAKISQVTASLGVSCLSENRNTLELIIKDADFNLYKAKRCGKNCVK